MKNLRCLATPFNRHFTEVNSQGTCVVPSRLFSRITWFNLGIILMQLFLFLFFVKIIVGNGKKNIL